MIRWLTFFSCTLLSFFPTAFAAPAKLTLHHQNVFRNRKQSKTQMASEDYKTNYYTQTLDHFNYIPQSYNTFKQRYVFNEKYWGGANSNAPILAYLGLEAPLDGDLSSIGIISDNAPSFKALMIYIEHRFYGESVAYGLPMEEAMKNATIRGYFNSAQAIADYAEVLLYIKRRFSAINSPIIVVGASYGGMLASWFRLKYPHVALGAIASSAPILYFDEIIPAHKGYFSVVSKDFKEASASCYKTIKRSWSEIDRVAALPNGLSKLSKIFNTCSKLESSFELKDYLESTYAGAAQYNAPPLYPVTQICGGIDGAPKGTDVLGRVYAGLVASTGNVSCYDVNNDDEDPSETAIGWSWQRCSEMVMPIGISGDDTMFPKSPFDLNNFIKACQDFYGVPPRPHWVTKYYGGNDIKLVLQKFASNIIFSNGLSDPYSSAGVLENLSDSLVAIYTKKGSHCLDIFPASQDDPEWLVMQRKREIEVVKQWLNQYYGDLYTFKGY